MFVHDIRVIFLHSVNFYALGSTFRIIVHEWTPICPIWSLWLRSCLQVGPSVIKTPRNSPRQVNKWEDCSFQRDVIIYSLLEASNRVNLHDPEYSVERWTLFCRTMTWQVKEFCKLSRSFYTNIKWLRGWLVLPGNHLIIYYHWKRINSTVSVTLIPIKHSLWERLWDTCWMPAKIDEQQEDIKWLHLSCILEAYDASFFSLHHFVLTLF